MGKHRYSHSVVSFLDVRLNMVRLTSTVRCLASANHVITRLRCTQIHFPDEQDILDIL